MSIWKFATISLSPKSILIAEGSKKSEMNVELCLILWLPRIKNKHNDIMGNHFILQNSTPPHPPFSQGRLIRKRNSLWYQCKVQPYWLASIIMWENALTLGHYTLGTEGAWWGLGCDAQALASITMISMQKKRWKWNIGQQVYWSCLKSFKKLSFCKNCNGANAHGFLTYPHDFQSLVDPYYTTVGHIWSPTLSRGDTWWSFSKNITHIWLWKII